MVLEPTGTYGDKLLELATQSGFEVRLAPPWKSSQFTSVLGIINKTDRSAAHVLAQMGLKLDLEQYHPPSQIMKERKQVQQALSALTKQCRMLKNQLHALEQRLSPSQAAVSALSNSLAAMEQEKQRLEEQLQELDDEEKTQFTKYAQSVCGIGDKVPNYY
ncbi:MAG: transposase [Saprospiraceae bacterium]